MVNEHDEIVNGLVTYIYHHRVRYDGVSDRRDFVDELVHEYVQSLDNDHYQNPEEEDDRRRLLILNGVAQAIYVTIEDHLAQEKMGYLPKRGIFTGIATLAAAALGWYLFDDPQGSWLGTLGALGGYFASGKVVKTELQQIYGLTEDMITHAKTMIIRVSTDEDVDRVFGGEDDDGRRLEALVETFERDL